MFGIESLETRRMMSVTPVAAPHLEGTVLVVTGTAANDNIHISKSDASTLRVQDNGVVTFFNNASVRSIKVDAGAGNDLVVLEDTGFGLPTQAANLIGGDGNDNLTGGAGNDQLDGGNGDDQLIGHAGNDALNGGAGSDVLKGEAGNDLLDAGDGNNQMFGGDGDDKLKAGLGADVYDGGTGTDLADYSDRTQNVSVVLDDVANDGQLVDARSTRAVGATPIIIRVSEGDNVKSNIENVTTGSGDDSIIAGTASVNNVFSGGAGNDKLRGRNGNDILNGGDGNDILVGAGQNDQLNGGLGDDLLDGGAGNDDLRGDAGKDILSGGVGIDQMRGGDGDDFIFAADTTADTIVDGGAGTDFADGDGNDIFSNVEIRD